MASLGKADGGVDVHRNLVRPAAFLESSWGIPRPAGLMQIRVVLLSMRPFSAARVLTMRHHGERPHRLRVGFALVVERLEDRRVLSMPGSYVPMTGFAPRSSPGPGPGRAPGTPHHDSAQAPSSVAPYSPPGRQYGG